MHSILIPYPDGANYVKVSDLVPNSSVTFIHRINQDSDLIALAAIKDVLDFNKVKASVVIPCMWQQQHDQRFNPDESFMLKVVTTFINNLNFERVTIFHPHSDVAAALLNNCQVIDNTYLLNKAVTSVCYSDTDSPILLSTDAGGYKGLMKSADKISWGGDVVSASKSRNYKNGKSVLTQQLPDFNFKSRPVIIVDDLCVYGGTFLGLAKLLKEREAGNLYLVVSHLTVKAPSPMLATEFHTVFTTNSKYEDFEYSLPNLEVIPINSFLNR